MEKSRKTNNETQRTQSAADKGNAFVPGSVSVQPPTLQLKNNHKKNSQNKPESGSKDGLSLVSAFQIDSPSPPSDNTEDNIQFTKGDTIDQGYKPGGGIKNNGLPGQLKSGIENLSGFSMDDVHVHYNSNKPAQLNANAYAQGSDIHLGPGQEKHLPHEAWHVVQQKQGRVNTTQQLKGGYNINDDQGLEKEADIMGSKAMTGANEDGSKPNNNPTQLKFTGQAIQLAKKKVIVTGVSHLVEMKDKTIYGGTERDEIIHGQQLEIDPSHYKHSRRGPNQEEFHDEDKDGPKHYNWYKVLTLDGKPVAKKLYVREDVFVDFKSESGESTIDKVHDVVEAISSVPGALIGNDGISGMADALNDKTVNTSSTGSGGSASDTAKGHATNMGIVTDSLTGITGLLAMAKGFKDLGDPEANAADLIETALSIEEGAMKTGESVSKLVHTASGSSDPTTASKFGSAFEGYGAAFAGIKSGFEGMRELVKLINKHQDYSTEDKARAAGEITLKALETAKSIVLSVKAFKELVDPAGGLSGQAMAAVPGLDIAIAGVNMIMQGYYLIVSNSNRKLMNKRRKELMGDREDDTKSASEFYRTKDAEITNKKEVIKDDKERLSKGPKRKEKRMLEERIKRLEGEIAILETQESDTGLTRDDVAEYTMVTELRDSNTKRVTRQGIHLATEMAKIAGAIATLTGVGAGAGAAIKGAAAAVDLALPAARLAKQAGRDRAARKIAKGKWESSKFDHTKSSAAKSAFRLSQVKYLIKMIVGLAYKDPVREAEEFKTVKSYLKVSGVNTKKLFKHNGDPQKQIKLLIEAIEQREFT